MALTMKDRQREEKNLAILHPIVDRVRPSPEQRPAVLARGSDVVVTAGAGTGKTRTLVARYLSLLAEGLPLRSIIAITFTKKAAREMRNRVRDEMRRFLEQSKLDPDELRHWQRLYSELDAARVGTIHSLCSEILRTHPAEAEVDPRFDVLEEGQSSILLQQTLDDALGWAAENTQVVQLFTLLGEHELRGSLARLLSQRLDSKEAFAHLPPNGLAHWQDILEQRQETARKRLLARPAWIQAVTTLRRNAASNQGDRLELQRRAALAAIDGAAGTLEAQLASLAQLNDIKLTGGRSQDWPGGKTQLTAVRDALCVLRTLWRDQADLLGLVLTPLDEAIATGLPSLQKLFGFARKRYQDFKRDRSALDYDDLEQSALELLQQNRTVRDYWQQAVQAILVDEFQDTNGRQRNLVKLLNGNRGRLFIVGDEKQSIYRFRGADVRVFREEQRQIAKRGQSFSLNTSYRAHRELIEALNHLLQPVLGKENPERPWAAPFAALKHRRERPAPGFAAPHIELHLTVGSKASGALHRAATALAGRIIALRSSGALENYADVAILCRASSSFGPYEDALDQAGIPFLTVAGRGFFQRPEIRDLLNALQALADPTDDLSMAGLLRSPALALSDEALYYLCLERDRSGANASLWDILQKMAGESFLPAPDATGDSVPPRNALEAPGRVPLSPQDRVRSQRAAGLIAQLHQQVGRISVAGLLKAFLDTTAYRAALLRAGQNRAARNVSKLLTDAHASGIVSVGEFLEYVTGLRESGAREGEARATADGAVQIMSVHAAKGLEFPVVVIGDISYRGRGTNPLLIDPEMGVLPYKKDQAGTVPAIYRLGKLLANDQEDAESDRLFYVAATRAKEKLILSGCIGLNRKGQPGRLGGWLDRIAGADALGLVTQQVEYDEAGAGSTQLDLQVGQSAVVCTIYEPAWAGAPSPRKQPDPRPALDVTPPLLAPVSAREEHVDQRSRGQERIPRQRVWRVVPAVERPRAPAWVIGSLVHEALAAWRFPDDAFAHWAQARARGHGVTDRRQLRNAVSQSGRLLRRFREHPLFREMDGAEQRLHEVPYSMEIDGYTESGIIDALYLHEGVWTIVEFKTDSVRDAAAFARLLEEEDYLPQAQRYRRAVELLLDQQAAVILCMLDYAGGIHLERL